MQFDPEYAQPSGGDLPHDQYKLHRLHAHGMAAEAFDAHFDVAQKHSSAIQSYSWHSTSLNGHLINRKKSEALNKPGAIQKLDKLHSDLIKAVDEAPPVHADMNVYSGISSNHARTLLARHKEGDTLVTKAWTSTSFNPEVAGKFAGTDNNIRTVLHIRIKKGQRGVLHCESASMHPNEKESLIKPGSRLRINKVYEPGDNEKRRIISAEIVD